MLDDSTANTLAFPPCVKYQNTTFSPFGTCAPLSLDLFKDVLKRTAAVPVNLAFNDGCDEAVFLLGSRGVEERGCGEGGGGVETKRFQGKRAESVLWAGGR